MSNTSPIPMMISLKIAEYYPNNFAFVAIQDESTFLWSAAISSLENGLLKETLFELEEYIYESGEDAVSVLNEMLKVSQQTVLTMSN